MREGIYRIPTISDNEPLRTTVLPQDEITIIDAVGKRLYLYEPDDQSKLIEGTSHKQVILKFKQTDETITRGDLNIRSIVLSNSLIDRMKNSLAIKDKEEVVRLLNSSDPKDWSKLLFGEKSKDMLRFAGLAELKRRSESIEEDIAVMNNKDYEQAAGADDYPTKYFIATGFIDVGNGKYINIEDLIDKSVEIDMKSAKIKILKNVLLYQVEEVLKANPGKVDQNELAGVMGIVGCGQKCIFNQEAKVGELIQNMLGIFNIKSGDEKSQGSQSAKAQLNILKKNFESLCGPQNSTSTLTSDEIALFNSLAIRYPEAHLEHYQALHDLKFSPQQAVYYLHANPGPLNVEKAKFFNERYGGMIEAAAKNNMILADVIPFLISEQEKNRAKEPTVDALYDLLYSGHGWNLQKISRLGELIRSKKMKNISIDKIYQYFSKQDLPIGNEQKFFEEELARIDLVKKWSMKSPGH